MTVKTGKSDKRSARRGKRCKCGNDSNWVVVRRNKYSYRGIEGFSPYSLLRCTKCGDEWKTAANYTDELPDMKQEARDDAGKQERA